ncbi:hypothetical protein Herbaro_05965 [Herbaspirillum sp. WKF16]|uniref:hypothetical protein n=1 Tax=Herbaspirillum sp. WKF16 TaxID=3028312 RepID=UPI0023A9E676|nr:hypothetical protein [Herbaspirillum sp. WKF16]WDZ97333.1 hypothetical protein Herbaro_05965 [Herbaspirillum sp. WKF16]
MKHYCDKYCSQIDILVEILESKLLPTFPSAQQDVMTEIGHLQEQAANCHELDMQQMSDSLLEYEYSKMSLLDGVQQALLNMYAIALYHLFEQQLTDCQMNVIGARAKRYGGVLVDEWREQFPRINLGEMVAVEIEEMKFLCNTLKHGNGPSADMLHQKWPLYFKGPWEREFLEDDPNAIEHVPRLQMPIFGNDVFVELADIIRFQQSLKAFWKTYLTGFSRKTSRP